MGRRDDYILRREQYLRRYYYSSLLSGGGLPWYIKQAIFYSDDGVNDSIGLSVADYNNVDPNLQSIFYINSTTLRPTVDAYALALSSPLLNVSTMIGSATKGKVALYTKTSPNALTAEARSYFGESLPSRCVTVWNTLLDGDAITLPLQSAGSYDFYVDWGDGSTVDHITAYNDTAITHVFATAGVHVVTITGTLTSWYFNNSGSVGRIYGFYGAGAIGLVGIARAFFGASNLAVFDTSGWDTSSITTFLNAFYATKIYQFDATGLDFANVTSYADAWKNCALVQESVDSILAACVASEKTGSIPLYVAGGTTSPPSAAGLANKDTLVSRGWTVTVNS